MGSLRKASTTGCAISGPQLIHLDYAPVAEDMLQIQYRGAELKLPSGVDIEAVAALLRSIQSL